MDNIAPDYPRSRFIRGQTLHRQLDALVVNIRGHAQLGLHLGAGQTRIEELINCDLFDPAADRKIDATDLSEFEDNSVDYIEHHHMLEHLSLEDAPNALQEWYRVLKPGGFLVISCPDLRKVMWSYLKTSLKHWLQDHSDSLAYHIKMVVGSQENAGMYHKSHYDSRIMREFIEAGGLKVDFMCSGYPSRGTPSLFTIARKR
ncbi:MAG: methyltransferase domain-containing protein [Pseudomonadota bacterium]